MSEAAGTVLKNVSLVASATDVFLAGKEFYENPSAGNAVKLALKSAVLALEVYGKANPLIGLGIAILEYNHFFEF